MEAIPFYQLLHEHTHYVEHKTHFILTQVAPLHGRRAQKNNCTSPHYNKQGNGKGKGHPCTGTEALYRGSRGIALLFYDQRH